MQDEPPKENEGVTFSEDKDYLAEYLELYRQNEDMVGWIKMCIRDSSQRANGFLTLAGGVIITFAKEILTLITG